MGFTISVFFENADVTYAIDAEAPNWIAVDSRGAELLRDIRDAQTSASPLRFGWRKVSGY